MMQVILTPFQNNVKVLVLGNFNKMTVMSTGSIIKQVTFPPGLLAFMQMKTSELGISIAEYIRHLVMNDTEDLRKNLLYVDQETEKSVGSAMEDIAERRVTTLKNGKDIRDHLQRLAGEK